VSVTVCEFLAKSGFFLLKNWVFHPVVLACRWLPETIFRACVCMCVCVLASKHQKQRRALMPETMDVKNSQRKLSTDAEVDNFE